MTALVGVIAQFKPHCLEEAGREGRTNAQLKQSRFRAAVSIHRDFLDPANDKKIVQIRATDAVRNAPRWLDEPVLYLTEGSMP